jgi:signal transduction histidine kinase
MIGTTVAAWLAETGGLRWPRDLFTLAVVLPTSLLLYVGRDTFAPLFLMLLMSWVGYVGTRRERLLALGLAFASIFPPLIARHGGYEDWVPWTFGLAASWSTASALAVQQRTLAALRVAQADLARQAAAEERRRIAREIHDVIAHSLTITMLHLTGARHVLQRDPQRAAEALAQAEQLGRQSLADVRRTVGLLESGANGRAGRDGERGPATAPLPGAEDIGELVAGYARAGLDVHLAVAGDPTTLPPAAGLGLYRIAQEALANAVKHAPGAQVEVALAVGPREATLRVRDSGPAAAAPSVPSPGGSGLGLAGMRERATLLGGTLSANRGEAGWLVECAVPLRASVSVSRES